MAEEIQKRLAEVRAKQPIEELERKWRKAKGRHSNAFYAVELLDLAKARAARYKLLME